MQFLPISINIEGKKILLIGGGRIASHKIGFIRPFTENISVVALEVCEAVKATGLTYIEKAYEKSDLLGAFLVYACTNITELNQQVKADAESLGILCNVVDNPKLCDFVSPAIYKKNHITVAVGSNGQEVYRAVAVRNKIREYFEQDPSVFTQSLDK